MGNPCGDRFRATGGPGRGLLAGALQSSPGDVKSAKASGSLAGTEKSGAVPNAFVQSLISTSVVDSKADDKKSAQVRKMLSHIALVHEHLFQGAPFQHIFLQPIGLLSASGPNICTVAVLHGHFKTCTLL